MQTENHRRWSIMPVLEVLVYQEGPGLWMFELFDHTEGVSVHSVSAGRVSLSELPSVVAQSLHAAIGGAIQHSGGASE